MMDSVTEWGVTVTGFFSKLVEHVQALLPNLLAAVALLFVGWLSARLLRALTLRLMHLIDQLLVRLYQQRGLVRSKTQPASAAVLANIIFWLVLLVFLTAAAQVLGLTIFVNWLDRLVTYLPTLFAGSVIILAGFLLSKLAHDLITTTAPSGTQTQRALLARLAQVSILASAIVIGAEQIGIRITFLVTMATVIVGSVLGGVALAVSLGARDYVANLIGARYLREHFHVGQAIRLTGYQGYILEITNSSVMLETDEGRVLLPGRLFNQEATVLLIGRTDDSET